MTIDFDEIPYDILQPATLVEIAPFYGDAGLFSFPTRVLLVGHKRTGTGAGTATALTPIRITRPEEAWTLFGRGAQLTEMVARFLANHRTANLWAMAVDEAAGAAAATGSLAVTGPATAAGTVSLRIGERAYHVAVAASDTATAIGAAIAAAITADTDAVVTAAADTGTVTVTYRHKGECGNSLPLLVSPDAGDALPAGVAIAVTAMATGATNPTLTTVFDAIPTDWYTDIVVPWTDATSRAALSAELATRYSASGQRDCHAWVGLAGTHGAVTTIGNGLNSPHITLIGAKLTSPTPPWLWASALAGAAIYNLTNDPARQLRTIELVGVLPPPAKDRWTDTEKDLALRDGLSTWSVTADGLVLLDRVVTTYQRTALGLDDRAWLDVMTVRTLTRIRYDWRAYVSALYPRHKLADDLLPVGISDAIVTPRRMHGSWSARCRLYEEVGWIEGRAETVAQSVFERDASDRNRLNGRQLVRVIGNLMVLAGRLEFEV